MLEGINHSVAVQTKFCKLATDKLMTQIIRAAPINKAFTQTFSFLSNKLNAQFVYS